MTGSGNRLMVAGTFSGSGKTTMTCAILEALLHRNLKTASFKCGPDYIDPMFHSEVIGAKSRNLDLFLLGENTTKYLYLKNSSGMDISVIEGVMGFYDGLSMDSDRCSSYALSETLLAPVVLTVKMSGMALSAAALVKGFLDFKKNRIKGLLLNGVSEAMYPSYKKMLEEALPVKVYGFLPHLPEAELKSRHLGLVTAEEVVTLRQKMDLLREAAEKYIDLDGLLELAETSPMLTCTEPKFVKGSPVRIAVARDRAFNFYYEDSLELLRLLGAELVPFSPLGDRRLPDGISGLFIGGGYPELYAKELSRNESMKYSIYTAIKGGLPTMAECGGYLYLGKELSGYPMVQVLGHKSQMTDRLQNFGYTVLTSNRDSLFGPKGSSIKGHEFHYGKSDDDGKDFHAEKPSGTRPRETGVLTPSLYAGFPHLHLWGNIEFAKQLMERVRAYENRKENGVRP